ncbi:MAG: hypothetical protein JO022_20665, partial [Acidobacteriaceae bacterium]|nr:hypothetical protein [Acidobacteriaceae bacterium]
VRGETVALEGAVLGKAVDMGATAEYALRVGNCTDAPQMVSLSADKFGWEAAGLSIEPSSVQLAAGESADVTVRVKLSDRVPPGGRVEQSISAVANGNGAGAASVKLVTVASLEHPYILHTPARWQEVRDKVAKYDWARAAKDEIVAKAGRWKVPDVAKAPKNLVATDNFGPFLFVTDVEQDLMAAGIAYQLTGETKYAAKVRQFMLTLSDPRDGYPKTFRGCNQSVVQEGAFFQHIVMAYDMALPSGVFSAADRAQIEVTLRLLMETIRFYTEMGAINNWNLSEVCGALYCGLVIEDLEAADRFYHGPSGLLDQLSKGVMNDGWWYECAISYNVWCSGEFTQAALALEPWGENLLHTHVPMSYTPNFSLVPWAMQPGLYGMSFEKWGPITRNYIDIQRMWDALLPFADYRGVMFGVNDATEAKLGGSRREIGGSPYELAYYAYRDPAYAAVVKQDPSGTRDLLYGVSELPMNLPERFHDSAYADNVGVAMLRSQTPGRPIREQLQAVLHYGTHGGFHGHFDRTDLISLMRYGRSFFNPEMIWYGYGSYMYKFYVQGSTSKNMVVVDRKMQQPVESKRLLWHTGKAFQATAVETNAPWATPPYGGMVYPESGIKSLQEKAFSEGRYLPKPDHEPDYGSVTEFTEPILQRRLMVVTDDYVLLADYLKGEKEHTFENLYQMKGFKGLEAANKKLVKHDGQWDSNPVLGAQFVTDCDWYDAAAPAKSRFEMKWGPGADNAGTRALASEDGVLNLDVHTLWPTQQQIMIGTAPEDHDVQKQLYYTVRGDDKKLAEGKFGAWILGQADIDVSVGGLKQLMLETKVSNSEKPTVFWGNARIITDDGKEIAIAKLPVKPANVLQPKEVNKDYFGGPIKIVGNEYANALPAQPEDDKQPAVLTVDLTGVKAARFKAVLGSDYPLGDESQRRKTYAVKTTGKQTRYLTVIEPYETAPVVKFAKATSADSLQVALNDGRVQTIEIRNLEGNGKDISVTLSETKGGQPTRNETTETQSR